MSEKDLKKDTQEKQILLERARELSIPKEDLHEGALHQIIAFRLGQRGYAASVEWVREVLPTPKITPIPGTPSYILGAINLRGSILTLTDLESFLSVGNLEGNRRPAQTLLLESPQLRTGILVDEVVDFFLLAPNAIEPPLSTVEEGHLNYLIGEIRLQGKVYAYMDMGTFLKNPKLLLQ